MTVVVANENTSEADSGQKKAVELSLIETLNVNTKLGFK